MDDVKFKQPSQFTCIKNLDHGELFLYNDYLYMKTDESVVSIPGGIVYRDFADSSGVRRVKAKLVFEEET